MGKTLRASLATICLMATQAFADCFEQAADYYRLPVVLLRAIATHESGMQPHLVHVNVTGSKDIGMMQINEMWLPELRKQGITREDLFDGCVNVFAGAWILAQNLHRTDGDVWRAVGAYNAGWKDTPKRRKRRARYVRSIQRIVKRLQDEAMQAQASDKEET